MERAFIIVVAVVGIVGFVGAVIALLSSRGAWELLDRDRLLMESDLRDPRTRQPTRTSAPTAADPHAVAAAERDEEIRQMLVARNARRRRHGQAELDIEAELQRLTSSAAGPAAPSGSTRRAPIGETPGEPIDSELLAEIRQLVIARNHRRARRGEPPLDVDAEIARQIARLNG